MSSIARPVARSVSRSVLAGQGVDLGYLIRSMFAGGEQGFAYDINDLSALFQDAAGTVPVTGVGQPVGLILDKSGRGNHAYQTTSASRPILRQNATTGAYYLAFDGSDDFLVTNSINFTSTDKVSLFAGVRKLSDAQVGSILSLAGSNGIFELYTPSMVGANNYVLSATGSTGVKYLNAEGYVAPHSAVLAAKIDIGQDLRSLSANGTKIQNSTVDLGTGNFGNYQLYIGRRGGVTFPFTGHIYGLIGIGKLTTEIETVAIEKELAKRTGVTLSV